MSSFTNRFSNRHACRGTATIETLLIMVPTWVFFMLCLSVMNYWETKHLDNAVELENQFARHTVTGLFFTKDNNGDPIEDGNYKWHVVEENDSPAKHYAYSTDEKGLHKMMTVRGTTTWTSFIWLRGQHSSWLEELILGWANQEADSSEGEMRKSWFNDMGGELLDEQREHLLLGT